MVRTIRTRICRPARAAHHLSVSAHTTDGDTTEKRLVRSDREIGWDFRTGHALHCWLSHPAAKTRGATPPAVTAMDTVLTSATRPGSPSVGSPHGPSLRSLPRFTLAPKASNSRVVSGIPAFSRVAQRQRGVCCESSDLHARWYTSPCTTQSPQTPKNTRKQILQWEVDSLFHVRENLNSVLAPRTDSPCRVPSPIELKPYGYPAVGGPNHRPVTI